MIKFGMKLPEIFNQLVRGYQKVRGQKPTGLDLLKIKQEAMQKFQEMRKILDMQGKPIDPSQPIMGGTQQGNALKSGIMKATGAGPKKVLSEDEIRKKLMDQNKKNLESMKNKLDDPEDMYASGGRIGLKDGEGIMKMASMEENEREFMRLVEEFMEQGFSQQEAIEEAKDTLERKSIATGGRAGFKDGEGIMQMASNDMNERLLEKIFEDLLEQGMDPKDAEIKAREIFNQMGDMSSMPDRGAQSIKLADGGITRVGLKDGLSKKLNKKFEIDGGTLRSMFFNRNNPILTGFNASELFDFAVRNIGPAIGLADGGRAAFKDGPKDPRRRGFMKAAVGVASMLPFGMGKIVKTAAPAIEKAADISGPALAKIVDTVMSLGKLISVKGRRVKEMVTKKKHEGVEVTEDIMDGSYTIKKGDKKIYYKPGRQDEMGIEDDIIEVIEKTVTKKAGGGVARLLGE